MKRVYLTPFNFKAIVLNYELKSKGIMVSGFLDANSYLWNKSYDSIGIFQRCYLPEATIIVCAERSETNFIIAKELKELGYCDENIQIDQERNIRDYNTNIDIDQMLNIFPKSNYYLMGMIEDFMKLNKMHQYGIKTNDISYEELFGLNRKEVFEDKIFLNKLEVIVTNKCSLKCKKCAAGMQYFENPTEFEVEQIIKDYRRTLEIIDWVDRIIIIGGEPFLCKDLDQLLEEMHNDPNTKKKVGAIKIITNGTIIPSQKILQAISKYNIIVWISNYREKSRNLCDLIEALRMNKINYSILNVNTWSDVIQLNEEKVIQSEKCLLGRRKQDCVTRCRTIAGGRFYLCSLLKSMDYLGITPFTLSDYVDLYDDNAREKICQMLDMNNPLPNACSFCSGCSEKMWNEGNIKSAEQTRMPLPYLKDRSGYSVELDKA